MARPIVHFICLPDEDERRGIDGVPDGVFRVTGGDPRSHGRGCERVHPEGVDVSCGYGIDADARDGRGSVAPADVTCRACWRSWHYRRRLRYLNADVRAEASVLLDWLVVHAPRGWDGDHAFWNRFPEEQFGLVIRLRRRGFPTKAFLAPPEGEVVLIRDAEAIVAELGQRNVDRTLAADDSLRWLTGLSRTLLMARP